MGSKREFVGYRQSKRGYERGGFCEDHLGGVVMKLRVEVVEKF